MAFSGAIQELEMDTEIPGIGWAWNLRQCSCQRAVLIFTICEVTFNNFLFFLDMVYHSMLRIACMNNMFIFHFPFFGLVSVII